MPLVREWTRGLSEASGAAVLVPGGIFAALLLLALAGSFGRLGGLGQAFSGPAAPGSVGAASTLGGTRTHAPALLGVVTTAATSTRVAAIRAAATASPVAGGAHPGAATGTAQPGAASGESSPGHAGGGHPSAPGTPASPPQSGCGGSCTQPAPPRPTLIDQVVAVGTSVTTKLPGQLGQATTQLLKQVSTTVDDVLPGEQHGNVVGQLGTTVSQLKP